MAPPNLSDISGFGVMYTHSQVLNQSAYYAPSASDAAGARASMMAFHGQTSANVQHKLAEVEVNHKGGDADQKGQMLFKVNAGAEDNAPSTVLTLDDTKKAVFAGDVECQNLSAANLAVDDISMTNLTVSGTSNLQGAVSMGSTVDITGATSVSSLSASGDVSISGTTTAAAVNATNVAASGTLAATGNTTLSADLTVSGSTSAQAVSCTTLTTSGDASVGGALTSTGLATFNAGVNITGDLNITSGVINRVSETVLDVSDKVINVASGNTSDSVADGSGLVVKAATDKTFLYNDTVKSFDSSEHFNLASGKEIKISGNTSLTSEAVYLGPSFRLISKVVDSVERLYIEKKVDGSWVVVSVFNNA